MDKKSLFLITLSLPLLLTSCGGSTSSSSSTSEQKEFSGITFVDKSFQYDGNAKSIYCDNVPSFATVTYEGNEKTNPGEYIVNAHIRANEYKPLDLSAKMTIIGDKKVFENLIFDNLTVEYDGNVHTITVQNVPSFANVVYTNNSKSAVGTYNATATVSAEGYYTKKLYATLKITARDFSGITFKDQTITYDGSYHSIYVEGAPEFATVTYTGNNKCEVGTYTVKAVIKATGYNTLTLTATMKIAKKMPVISTLVDRTLIYDGTAQLVSFALPEKLPSYSTATYKVDGVTVSDKFDIRVTSLGEHTVSVTLANEKYSYEPTTTTAKINVIKNTIGTTDPSKTAFKITNDLKYKTLRNEILKGNFTVKCDSYDDYYYPDKTEKHVLSSTTYSYVDNGEVFSFYDNFDRDDTSTYRMYENSYTHKKIIGDYVLSAELHEGIRVNECCYKYPADAYKENVIGDIGLRSMAYLDEASDGGFENSQEGGDVTKYGTFEIDPTNNQFKMTVTCHYYHTEWDHDERTVYSIYNIGNTKIDMIDQFKVDDIPFENFEFYRFRYNGFDYYFDGTSFRANTVFDSISCTYLDKGQYFVPAVIEGYPVSSYTVSVYDKYVNKDCSGYTLKLYCNNKGVYQGSYSELGQINSFSNINIFVDDGGNILYYGEW